MRRAGTRAPAQSPRPHHHRASGRIQHTERHGRMAVACKAQNSVGVHALVFAGALDPVPSPAAMRACHQAASRRATCVTCGCGDVRCSRWCMHAPLECNTPSNNGFLHPQPYASHVPHSPVGCRTAQQFAKDYSRCAGLQVTGAQSRARGRSRAPRAPVRTLPPLQPLTAPDPRTPHRCTMRAASWLRLCRGQGQGVR